MYSGGNFSQKVADLELEANKPNTMGANPQQSQVRQEEVHHLRRCAVARQLS